MIELIIGVAVGFLVGWMVLFGRVAAVMSKHWKSESGPYTHLRDIDDDMLLACLPGRVGRWVDRKIDEGLDRRGRK